MLIIQYLKGITHFALYYLDANTSYEEVQENNDDDDLIQYIIYEDRHWGVCNKLVGYETMLKDLNKKAFVELYYYGRKTLLGNKYEHFNDLYKFQKQRVKLYNADICGITLI